jgi:hypothetical protein
VQATPQRIDRHRRVKHVWRADHHRIQTLSIDHLLVAGIGGGDTELLRHALGGALGHIGDRHQRGLGVALETRDVPAARDPARANDPDLELCHDGCFSYCLTSMLQC